MKQGLKWVMVCMALACTSLQAAIFEDEEARLLTECEKPRGEFRFMLIRGQEFPGRV